MAEPEPTNCKRCGKGVLAGLVEEIYPMQLDLREVPYADACLLKRYGIPVVQVRLRKLGKSVHVSMSKMFEVWDGDPGDWVALMPHGCVIEAWLRRAS